MGILQARILEWVAVLFSRDQTQVSLIAGGFTIWVTKEAYYSFVICSLKSGPMMHPTLIPQKGDFVCLFLDSSCTYYLWFSDNSLLYTLVWIFIHLIGWTIHYDNFFFDLGHFFKNYLFDHSFLFPCCFSVLSVLWTNSLTLLIFFPPICIWGFFTLTCERVNPW